MNLNQILNSKLVRNFRKSGADSLSTSTYWNGRTSDVRSEWDRDQLVGYHERSFDTWESRDQEKGFDLDPRDRFIENARGSHTTTVEYSGDSHDGLLVKSNVQKDETVAPSNVEVVRYNEDSIDVLSIDYSTADPELDFNVSVGRIKREGNLNALDVMVLESRDAYVLGPLD